MKQILAVISLLLLLAPPVQSQTRTHRVHNGRVNVYHHGRFERGIRVWRFDSPTASNFAEHFPFGPGGITAGIKNPSPRSAADVPACYYDTDGLLFFAQSGKNCAPDWNSRATQE